MFNLVDQKSGMRTRKQFNSRGMQVYDRERRHQRTTIKDPFSVPFLETALESVAWQEVYFFLNGYSGYSQIRLDVEAQEKTTIITEWGAF